MNPLDYFYAIPPIFFKMWVKYISIYTNIISFQRLFPILLILNILCKHTQHASFFSQTRLPILFSSSPLHGLIVDETRNCMTVKKKEEREREKKEERTVQACFIFHACFAIRNLCGHAFRLFSLHTLITHRFSTLYYSSISISIYRADCVSAEEIVAGICTALNISGECECVWERERNSVHCLYRWYQVQYVSLINLNQIQYQRL